MCSKVKTFPKLYKAYSYLRINKWVVKSRSQYGVDYVAYCYHLALVHSEYAVIVLSGKNGDPRERLKVWSDLHCAIRLCGGVAKTLLVLHVQSEGIETESPVCLQNCVIKEQTISRWIPEQNREPHSE
ncbi:hypothetical protein RND81_14G183700 [Saponaria officinalis]|uniref:tRNA-intron lyase n=1 Tax=Saponaria officinalis TaxID=3572 RepID=A0AAW1GS71_SAPOF